MTVQIPALPPAAKRAVWRGAILVTLASVAASDLVTFLISLAFGLEAALPAYLVAAIIPILLAGPGSYFQLKRLEQVRMAYRDLERAASIDWLTGCLNRGAFTARATLAAKSAGESALLIVDADGFKAINDSFGHDVGDQALRSIAAVIRANVRETDLVGRLGGEEFGVFLSEVPSRHAWVLAEAIREAVEDIAFSPSDSPHPLSVSVGIAATAAPVPFASLYRLADEQLYVAKAAGRNCVAGSITEVEPGRRAA